MDREWSAVTGFLLLLFGLWLSFALHQSPRFPGSGWGGVLGVSAALLMLVPLAYTLVKRIAWVKERVVDWLPLSRLLGWHVYASIAGAFPAILHSGHRFQSWLGILLISAMLLSIVSGYIGRHFLRYLSQELKERQASLVALRASYDELLAHVRELPTASLPITFVSSLRFRFAALLSGVPVDAGAADLGRRAISLTRAIADTEYSVRADEVIKRRLRRWLILHIATSIGFYLLLALHIVAGIQYGLRWFS
jgi:hypothetical protein